MSRNYPRRIANKRPYIAFSSSDTFPICVDCAATAEVLIGYVTYPIGDVVCINHDIRRWRLLGKLRVNYRGPLYKGLKLQI